ncbi:MAG: DinB family protein [Tetrasphaera sp.]
MTCAGTPGISNLRAPGVVGVGLPVVGCRLSALAASVDGMINDDAERLKATLVAALQQLNDAVLWKLDGLGDYDLRRPLTPTGSNLLGIVKHLASVQAGYFGDTFGHPFPDRLPWFDPAAEINADMWATPQESREFLIDLFRRSWAHAQQTFAVTALDATGEVPWWPPERRHPTLHTMLVHMTVEAARHAGHIDIIRELIDGQAGRFGGDRSMPGPDEVDWPAYVERVAAAAREAARG